MDHYNTLGVPRTATADEIKKAYRKLAMEHHPDKGGDINKFQELTNAYETLSDVNKRYQYDNPQAQSQGFPKDFSAAFDIGDIFSQIFGQQGFQQRTHQKQVFRTQVVISLIDSFNGSNQIMQLNTQQGPKVVNFAIPKGVDSGDQVRYDNLIDDASLIVQFVVQKELRFERTGQDLHSEVPISVLDLIIGTTIEFTTLVGKKLEVIIKPFTQPNQHIRLGGYGMPISNTGGYGDQILLLKPYVPDNISQEIIDSIKNNNSK